MANWLRSTAHAAMAWLKGNPFGDRPDDPIAARIRAILDEWRLLSPPASASPAWARLARLADQLDTGDSAAWTWDDLEGAKLAVVMVYPEVRLKRWLWSVRDEFKALTSESAYAAYLADAPNPQSASGDELRQDGIQLLQELRRLYRLLPEQERRRSSLSLWATGIAAGILAVGVSAFWWLCPASDAGSAPDSGMPMLPVVLLCGALGGAISVYERIQQAGANGNPASRVFYIASQWGSVYLAPILGAMFAIVLYVTIASGLIGGQIFPSISTGPPKAGTDVATTSTTIAAFATWAGPKEGVDVAKVLVWSFLAGFAERLVPDTLNRLAAAARQVGGTQT